MTTVLVTRAVEDAGPLCAALRAEGYEVLCVPLIERNYTPKALEAAARSGPFDGMVLTSPAAVKALAMLCAPPQVARVAAVGSATERAAIDAGYEVHARPDEHTGQALADLLGPLHGQRWLYPRAQKTSSGLERRLRDAGAELVDVVTYANDEPAGWREALNRAMPRVDVVTLLSGSAARRFANAPSAPHVLIAVIGPSTRRAALAAGLTVAGVASPYTAEGLVALIGRLTDSA